MGVYGPGPLEEERTKTKRPRVAFRGGRSAGCDIRAPAGSTRGSAFQGITALWVGDGEALGELTAPAGVEASKDAPVHPALLDACLQLIGPTIGRETSEVSPALPRSSPREFRRLFPPGCIVMPGCVHGKQAMRKP